MATPTVAALAEEIATEVGEAYSDRDVAPQFRAWVSEIVQMLLSAARWPFQTEVTTVTTAASAGEYALSASNGDIRLVQKVGSARTLEYRSIEELVSRGLDLTIEGEPVAWYYGQIADTGELSIAFFPVPDAEYSYNVHRERILSQIDDDSATPIPLPVDFLPAIRDGVRGFYREQAGDANTAQFAWARYSQKLQMLRSKYASPRAAHSQMRVADLPPVQLFDLPRLPQNY